MGQGIPNPVVPTGLGVGRPMPTSPGLSEIHDWQEIESLPISKYMRDIRGNIVNANSDFYYDTAYIKTAVQIPANAKKSLFVLGKSDTDTQFGTATSTGEKTEFLTNMVSRGMFDDNVNFIMEGIGVDFLTTADLPTTVAANGAITAPNYTASVVISAANNVHALRRNLELRFIRGDGEIKRRAPLGFWPAPPGVGLEGSQGSPNGGFVQNSHGGLAQLARPVVLGGGERFQFDLANIAQAAFTPTMDMLVTVVIWGLAVKPQYSF